MAITGPSSYVPCINTFLPHWAEANLAGQGSNRRGELTVRVSAQWSAVRRQDLLGWRDELVTFAARIEDHVLARDLARARNKVLREELHERLTQFNRRARALLHDTVYARTLPKVPVVTVGESRICLALNELNTLWITLNKSAAAGEVSGLEGPLLLRDGYDQPSFQAGIARLRASYEEIVQHEQQLKMVRTRRNLLQETVYATLRVYRATIQAEFPAQDAFVLTLPRLTPLPGSTPEPVAVQAVWDAGLDQAVITWEASDNANLDHYEVRYSPGSSYDSDAETVQAIVAPDAPREYLTRKGLTNPGDTALFKVYVVLETGNERGSEVLAAKRPVTEVPMGTRMSPSVPAGDVLSA
jgi:hypothetical protein